MEGQHINEVHIISNTKKSYLLSLSQLPSGETSSYYWHIMNSLKDIAKTYSLFNNESLTVVLENIYDKIKCTLIDRTVVNKATVRMLTKDLGINLHLNCNVHPLDSMSAEVRKFLKGSTMSK